MQIKLKGSQRHPFGQAIQKLDHNILGADSFNDAQLLKLLDEHPENLMDIFAQGSSRACMRGAASSSVLLEAVRRGALDIRLRRLDQIDSYHGRLTGDMHKAFSSHMRVRTSDRKADLTLSSGEARSGYRVDTSDMSLWHLRGRKRIYIYPSGAPYVHPRRIQLMALKLGTDKIPYKREFEPDSIAIDLEPGEVICWPHLSPYRMDNLEDLNVSLHLGCMTMPSRLRMGSYYFDGFVNRLFRTQRAVDHTGPVAAFTKTAAAGLIQKSGIAKTRRKVEKPCFKVNLAHPNFLEPI